MNNLENNTAELNKILAAVNALPEAGGEGIVPAGTIEITENGTYDVTSYASAEVNVSVATDAKTVYIGTAAPTNDVGVDGDIYIVRSETA